MCIMKRECFQMRVTLVSAELRVRTKCAYRNVQNAYLGNNRRVVPGNWKFPLITFTTIPWIIAHGGNFNKVKIPKYFQYTNVCMTNENSMKEQRNSLNKLHVFHIVFCAVSLTTWTFLFCLPNYTLHLLTNFCHYINDNVWISFIHCFLEFVIHSLFWLNFLWFEPDFLMIC